MNRRLFNSKDCQSTFLDSSDDCDENGASPWNLYHSNNEETSLEQKTEILWSREQKHSISESDFFKNDYDSFSDLTGRSTSSCSWHNDDFDMKSSNKVSQSLEAIDDALYDNQRSSFISDEVFQECCDWSKKFVYFRVKGEQIIKPLDDSMFHTSSQTEDLLLGFQNSSNGLHVEGKKMAIHVSDKSCKRSNTEVAPSVECEDEEIIVCDGQYEEYCVPSSSQNTNIGDILSDQLLNDAENIATLKSLEEKVIEKLAQNVWPKVLEVLKNTGSSKKPDKTSEHFQLPPISTAIAHRKYISSTRPKTEGTNFSNTDFPKLSGILTVSPKILQEGKECKSGKSNLRSRPNSEIHFSRRNHVFSNNSSKNTQKTPELLRTATTPRQVQFLSRKGCKKDEKDNDKTYLPALEEDITDPIEYLKGFSLQTESKNISTSVVTHFSKNPECFLPPIDTDDRLHPDVKLTKSLFTYFGPDLKCSNVEQFQKPKTPGSRPNTCATKKSIKQPENFNQKLLGDNCSSINNSNQIETKIGDNFEKQVTLFPIVTSLVPSKEKNCNNNKKGFINNLCGRKR